MPEYLHIFVNGRKFDASDGVKEFMDGGEIADLVGILHTQAVVHLEASIDHKYLRIDTFCPFPSRDEGRHSRVRITHLPSGFVFSQQNHNSQAKNRSQAMSSLRARLYESGHAQRKRIGIHEEIHIQTGTLFSVTSQELM